MLHVAGEETDQGPTRGFMRLERDQQFFDAGIESGRLRRFRELGRQQADIAIAYGCDPVLGLALGVTGHLQQLAHDLRVGFPVEAIGIDGAGGAHFLEQGSLNGSASGAVGPEQRSVDVEQDQTHGTENNVRDPGAW